MTETPFNAHERHEEREAKRREHEKLMEATYCDREREHQELAKAAQRFFQRMNVQSKYGFRRFGNG